MPKITSLKPFTAIAVSFAAAIGYGIFVRLAFDIKQFSGLFGTISVGFLFVVPFVLGALTVFFAPKTRIPWLFAIFAPWGPCLIFAAIAAIFTWEAWICVVMALPIFLVMSTIGGVATFTLFKLTDKSGKSQTGVMGLLLLAPFLITPLERQLPPQDSIRVVHTQIEVKAGPQTVWRNITRVSPITPAEHRFSFFYLAGLPRPMQATLTYNGVGGVRRGQWENGLAFSETITQWSPGQSYTMQMQVDTRRVGPSPLPLKEIGGQYFDVIQGKYAIQPVDKNKVILHFTSTHRLTTHFNFYGGLWTDFFMRDVQNYILQIVKARAEAQR